MNSGENSADGVDIAGTDWDRLLGEPSRWYSRFTIYRLLGPGRTLEAAHKTAKVEEGRDGSPESSYGQAWIRNSRAWDWRTRCEAWDDAERDRLCEAEAHGVSMHGSPGWVQSSNNGLTHRGLYLLRIYLN